VAIDLRIANVLLCLVLSGLVREGNSYFEIEKPRPQV